MKKILVLAMMVLGAAMLTNCGGGSKPTNNEQPAAEQVVNVYTHRHYDSDKELFAAFTKATGIQVNVTNASADELIQKMEQEGEQSVADVLITVDAGRLQRAKEKDLLQPATSTTLQANVPSKFRDPENYWYGLTYRARVVAYNKERVDPATLSSYEALTDAQWKGKILVRSSGNIYNQSLMASIIVANGADAAKAWAEGMVANMARTPKGNDRDQVKAVAAGEGDLAIVNTYYIGKLLNSDNEEERKAGEAVGIFFPNQGGRGTHINVSGAGVAKHAPNKDNAVKFIEYLTDGSAQQLFAEANYEYPVKPGVPAAALLQSWGEFTSDGINLSLLGVNNRQAVMLFDEAGWK